MLAISDGGRAPYAKWKDRSARARAAQGLLLPPEGLRFSEHLEGDGPEIFRARL